MSAIHAPGVYPTITMAPWINKASETNVFPHLVLVYVMIDIDHDLLTKFLKVKPTIF